MGIFGIAKRGLGMLGKKKVGKTISSVKPGVGGLKESSRGRDDMIKSIDTGVKKFGRKQTNKILSEQKGKKSLGSIIKKSGDLERQKKKLFKK